MISIKYWHEPRGTDNVVGVVVHFFGPKEAGDAFKLAYDKAKEVFGERCPLHILSWANTSGVSVDGDFIVAVQDYCRRSNDKRKRKTFYLPFELEPACFRRDFHHK